MNKIIVTGNLVNDGEIRTTANNKEIYSGRIAVSRGEKDEEGNYITDYFSFSYWNPSDYVKKNAKKGNKAVIEGKIINESYDGQDGSKKYTTKIKAQLLELNAINNNQDVEIPQNVSTEYDTAGSDIQLEDSDLPF